MISRILVKTDQEPAVRTWVKDLVAEREDGRTFVEEAHVKSSGSNGRVEQLCKHWRNFGYYCFVSKAI